MGHIAALTKLVLGQAEQIPQRLLSLPTAAVAAGQAIALAQEEARQVAALVAADGMCSLAALERLVKDMPAEAVLRHLHMAAVEAVRGRLVRRLVRVKWAALEYCQIYQAVRLIMVEAGHLLISEQTPALLAA